MDDESTKFQLKYVGTRFDGARLPVDVLSDLPAFRDLLAAFAKDEWRALNADRKRLPKGFDKSLAFDLVAVEDGSAVPVLDWNRATAQAQLPGFTDELQDVVEASFRDIVALIDGAGNNLFPQSLSSEHVRALNRLGAGLRDNERIEFPNTEGANGKVVFLDTYRRKNLITRVRETYQARFESTGIILGTIANPDTRYGGHVEVQTTEHGIIKVPLDRERLRHEFDGNIDALVQFELQIELDNMDKYRNVIEVHDIVLIDAGLGADLERCRNRLANISKLADNWDNEGGAPVRLEAVAAAGSLLSKRPSLSRAYKIYPTEDGGVLFEFEANGWDYSIAFAPEGSAEMYGIQINGRGEMDPMRFEEIGEEFTKVFDERVGRK